jgi:hypothetical protein
VKRKWGANSSPQKRKVEHGLKSHQEQASPEILTSGLITKKANTQTASSSDLSESASLLPSDSRLHLCAVFCEAFNNFEPKEFAVLLASHCEEQLVLVTEYLNPERNPFGPCRLELRSRELVIRYFESTFISIPDSVFRIFISSSRVYADNSAAVVCYFSLKGTKTCNIEGIDKNKGLSVVLSAEKNRSDGESEMTYVTHVTGTERGSSAPNCSNTSSSSSSSSSSDSNNCNNGYGGNGVCPTETVISGACPFFDIGPLLDGPIELSISGSFTYHLNSSEKISKMIFSENLPSSQRM